MGADVYRHAMGATGDQYQRVDGTLGMEYRSTGKQLTGQLLLVVPFKTGQYDSIRARCGRRETFRLGETFLERLS